MRFPGYVLRSTCATRCCTCAFVAGLLGGIEQSLLTLLILGSRTFAIYTTADAACNIPNSWTTRKHCRYRGRRRGGGGGQRGNEYCENYVPLACFARTRFPTFHQAETCYGVQIDCSRATLPVTISLTV